MNKFIKSMLLAMAGVITPILFTKISALAPGFPLSQDVFSQLIVWMITGILGTSSAVVFSRHVARLDTRTPLLKNDFHISFFWAIGAFVLVLVVITIFIL